MNITSRLVLPVDCFSKYLIVSRVRYLDQNSVGTVAQQRILLEGTHYECGDVIQVQFTDDGNPTGAEPTVGQGTVSLLQ